MLHVLFLAINLKKGIEKTGGHFDAGLLKTSINSFSRLWINELIN
jgi:hypothetical protein